MQDAVAQVKGDLGRDAVILHTRRFKKGGILGFFAKEMVEVMAAIETPVAVAIEKTLPPQRVNKEEETKTAVVQLELANMRKLLEQVLSKIPQSEKQLSPLFNLLIKNDVDAQIAENLIRGLPNDKSIIGSDQAITRKLLFDLN